MTRVPPPDGLKVLVLNDDYTPLNVVHWKKAMKRLFPSPCEKCNERGWVMKNNQQETCRNCNGTKVLPAAVQVEYFDAGYVVRDGTGYEHLVPSVIANAHHIHRKHRKVPYSKRSVLRRDGFRCQYCGESFSPEFLTVDHVVPRSRWNGNKTSPTQWGNIVAACKKCNTKKADRTPEEAKMPLKKLVGQNWVQYKKPKTPSHQEISLGLTYKNVPSEWEIYVAPFRKSSKFG